jgi:hypothetical protein
MSLKDDPCHSKDKLALFIIAGLVVGVLGLMVALPFMVTPGKDGSIRGLPDKADVLLGGIATGLILFLRDLVQAVKASWEEVTRAETNKQLAASGPANEPPPKNAVEAADRTAGAALEEAGKIKGEPT